MLELILGFSGLFWGYFRRAEGVLRVQHVGLILFFQECLFWEYLRYAEGVRFVIFEALVLRRYHIPVFFFNYYLRFWHYVREVWYTVLDIFYNLRFW